MEEDIRAALEDIKTSMRDGLKDVKERIGELVTKGEFNAVIDRIDSQHNRLVADFSEHIRSAESQVMGLRKDDDELLKTVRKENESIREDLENSLREFRTTSRWAIGLIIPGAALLFSLIQWVMTLQGA